MIKFIKRAWRGEVENGFSLKLKLYIIQFLLIFICFVISHVLTSDKNPLDPLVIKKYSENFSLYLLALIPVQVWIIVSIIRYARKHSKFGILPESVHIFILLSFYLVNLLHL
jgi:hypothetical protein